MDLHKNARLGDGQVTAAAGGSANITASETNQPNGQICSCSPSCTPVPFFAQAQVTTKADVQISQTTVPNTIHTGSDPSGANIVVTIFQFSPADRKEGGQRNVPTISF